MRSLSTHGRLQDLSPFTGSNPQGAVRLLMHPCQERGVAGVVADRIEQWIHADKCHVEAVAVERALKRFERMVEIANSKIIDADLVSRARAGWGSEESAGARAPIGLPPVLLIHAKKSSDIDLWLVFVQRDQIVLHGLVVIALLLVDETHVVVDGAGPLFHFRGAL